MVWHAYMLNPRAFLEDCLRQSKMSFWATGLPWNSIIQSIDEDTLAFDPGKEAKINFEARSGRLWDNMLEGPAKSLLCFSCKQELLPPWTEGSIGCDPDVSFAHCTGYADKSLRISCPACKHSITHDGLCVQMLRSDVQKLLRDGLPMPGTFLSSNGTPVDDHPADSVSFPNRLIKEGIRSELLQLTDPVLNEGYTLETIRDRLEEFLKDRSLMRRVNGTVLGSRNSSMPEKISVRNMLSRYWDNSSPFSINLIGAVIRQGTFLEKMDDIGWIRLPTLKPTISHFIDKYDIFFKIISKNKGHAVVPTLDVDLVWHTHQLSPALYYSFSTSQTEGIFVNHDDKVDEFKLNDAFAWTSLQYQKLTGGKVYSECTCWYCDAVRGIHNQGLARLISPSAHQAKANAALLHESAKSAPNGSRPSEPHISSHNAVRILAQTDPRAMETQTARLRSHWEKSQRASWNTSGSKGTRNSQGPYMRDSEIHPDLYPCNPVCVAPALGSGNCISGTQGAGVEQGACVSGPVVAESRGRGKSFCSGIAGCGMSL